MHRRLRIDIRKDVTLVILVDRLGGNASLNDFAEKAAHHGNSVQGLRACSATWLAMRRPLGVKKLNEDLSRPSWLEEDLAPMNAESRVARFIEQG